MRTDYTQYLVNVDNAMVLCCLDIDYEKDFISVAAGKSTYPIRNVQLSEAERNNSLSVAIIPLKIAFPVRICVKGTDMCFFPSRYGKRSGTSVNVAFRLHAQVVSQRESIDVKGAHSNDCSV
jgi:hypothetical protein